MNTPEQWSSTHCRKMIPPFDMVIKRESRLSLGFSQTLRLNCCTSSAYEACKQFNRNSHHANLPGDAAAMRNCLVMFCASCTPPFTCRSMHGKQKWEQRQTKCWARTSSCAMRQGAPADTYVPQQTIVDLCRATHRMSSLVMYTCSSIASSFRFERVPRTTSRNAVWT